MQSTPSSGKHGYDNGKLEYRGEDLAALSSFRVHAEKGGVDNCQDNRDEDNEQGKPPE